MGDPESAKAVTETPAVAREPAAAHARAGEDRAPAAALRAYALAALAPLAEGGPPAVRESPEIHDLFERRRAVAPDGAPWTSTLAATLRRPAAADLPLMQLAAAIGMSAFELLAVALAAAVEDDAMAGRALARLQAPVGGSRPTLGLLAAALGVTAATGVHPIDLLVAGAAVRSGLLVVGDGPPLPERSVHVPVPLALALRGLDGAWPGMTVGLGETPEVPLPPSILDSARRHAAGLIAAPRRALVLRTGMPAEGRSVAAAMARAMGRRAVFVETDKTAGLCPWLLLRRLVPVFCLDLGPGERKAIPSIPAYDGPSLALCGPDGSVETAAGAAASWSIAVPPPGERRALWSDAVGAGEAADDLARHHRHGSGRIAALGRLARQRAATHGRAHPTRDDVVAASRSGEGIGLDALAQPLPDPIPDEALVTAPVLRGELDALLLRCRLRDGLADGLGVSAAARYRPGVRALFVGPSGTGKTLAAGWLATRLGLPLYRVDLAAVTSKYIGETEKNLAQLLARAEQSEVVLLFDEADSLFGKRTEVREANDRFANAQTNYLLQRIETFDGITILTSNSRARFDSAFTRRLDLIVEFPLPGPEERRALWLAHLGAAHALAPRDVNRLAAVADLCGGHVRNAVLAAAALAQAAGRPIGFDDVVRGLAGEYRKLGRQVPVELGA